MPAALLALALAGTASATVAPPGFGTRRIYLDAGHGTGRNQGAQTLDCTDESAFVLDVSRGLAAALEATGHFVVELSRTSSAGPSYPARLQAAKRMRADALVSIHGDTRGAFERYARRPGQWCPRNADEPGFSVLYSDRGSPRQDRARRGLARAVAERMAQAGFPPYDGADYGALYERDEVSGVFIDRRGLFMLRRPPMPSVIVETAHVWHPEEFARWQTTAARKAFHAAVLAALYEALGRRPRAR